MSKTRQQNSSSRRTYKDDGEVETDEREAVVDERDPT